MRVLHVFLMRTFMSKVKKGIQRELSIVCNEGHNPSNFTFTIRCQYDISWRSHLTFLLCNYCNRYLRSLNVIELEYFTGGERRGSV